MSLRGGHSSIRHESSHHEGGTTLQCVLTCIYGNSQKWGLFSEWCSDLCDSSIMNFELGDMGPLWIPSTPVVGSNPRLANPNTGIIRKYPLRRGQKPLFAHYAMRNTMRNLPFLAHLCILHDRLICVAFCPPVCLSITQNERLSKSLQMCCQPSWNTDYIHVSEWAWYHVLLWHVGLIANVKLHF